LQLQSLSDVAFNSLSAIEQRKVAARSPNRREVAVVRIGRIAGLAGRVDRAGRIPLTHVEHHTERRARGELNPQVWPPVVDGDAFDAIVVNADPLASAGPDDRPLALSGYVLLARVPERLTLPHHLVLFSRDYENEFRQLFAGEPADDPTVYVCHPATTDPTMAPDGTSGLYLMTNAPPLAPGGRAAEPDTLRTRCLRRLEHFAPGLVDRLDVLAEHTPADFARRGAPRGSLYGFLPHGRLAALRRPRMRGTTPGVFFAGGGTHPGGGVPLVMLSGRYAAAMALEHLGLVAAA